MDGRAVAERVRAEVAIEIARMDAPGLATVLVGDDPASRIYIRLKHEAAEGVGIRAVDHRLPEHASQDEVVALVRSLNADDAIDGILVQTPLPAHLDESAVLGEVAPSKDVDGLHPCNAGRLYLGEETFVPATPLGVMRLLAEYDVQLAGAHAVVVGRSAIVGKPVALLLLAANATVTVCHSRTRDLGRQTLEADVLVAAVGVPALIRGAMVKPGAAVIDVGVNRTDSGVVGDVDPEVGEVAGFLTPVPGGVGPMTIACLLQNTVRAARYRGGLLAFPQG
ncbi:MAG: bifunctional 5,10-methylenetetrahydrofolate dehydrogenase/5,10-methenyltetrahydrofolate cyclohydrolase [Actinobacteria bacterium]|nr:bifunctional 5,10-methylenetetrahydrofolate dehydrogenase/5,10-methenyltetrahydrofolate cyclohydrolase [Actinomycetota bacterium]